MIEVKFLVDFRGRLTDENFYKAQDVASFDHGIAKELIARGIVEPVKLVKTVTPKKKRQTRKSTK